jgi:hypothetical protein
MTFRELVPVGVLGQRFRKAFIAGALLACAWSAWQLARDPAWDGWWDAFNWPQLFLGAPILFLLGATVWQLAGFVAEWFYGKAKRKTENLKPITLRDTQKTLKFWLRDCLRVCALYVVTCAIGEIPMAVSYLSAVRGWHLHWWWSRALDTSFLLMIAVWWVLERIYQSRTH